MKTLHDICGYSDSKFDTVDISEIDCGNTGDTPEDWEFIRARSITRTGDSLSLSPLYTEGIFKVVRCKDSDPLIDSDSERMKTDQIINEMPRRLAKNHVVPSVKGQYVSIVEVYGSENNDGTISINTKSTPTFIPIEYVIETLTYDEVVVELLDEKM